MYRLIITSQQNYSDVAYFGNYRRISVAIETSAKCTQFTLMPLKTNMLFLKPKIIYSALSFYAVLLSKIDFYGLQKLKGKHVFRKIEIIYVWHIVTSTSVIQAVSRQCFQMCAVKIQYRQTSENWKFQNLK